MIMIKKLGTNKKIAQVIWEKELCKLIDFSKMYCPRKMTLMDFKRFQKVAISEDISRKIQTSPIHENKQFTRFSMNGPLLL